MSEELEPGDEVTVSVVGGARAAVVELVRGDTVDVRWKSNGRRVAVARRKILGQRHRVPLTDVGAIETAIEVLTLDDVPRSAYVEPAGEYAIVLPPRERAVLVPVPKPRKPERSKRYMKFVVAKPCAVCRADPPSDPHHWGPRGMGQKTSDLRTVPLCRRDHDHFHDHGTFPNMNGLQTKLLILSAQVSLLVEFFGDPTESTC